MRITKVVAALLCLVYVISTAHPNKLPPTKFRTAPRHSPRIDSSIHIRLGDLDSVATKQSFLKNVSKGLVVYPAESSYKVVYYVGVYLFTSDELVLEASYNNVIKQTIIDSVAQAPNSYLCFTDIMVLKQGDSICHKVPAYILKVYSNTAIDIRNR